jgi:hypothetical protein
MVVIHSTKQSINANHRRIIVAPQEIFKGQSVTIELCLDIKRKFANSESYKIFILDGARSQMAH